MYKNILFDFDGTIFDTVDGIVKSVRYALNKHGMDAPDAVLRCFAGPPMEDMFMQTFDMSRDEAKQLRQDFQERYIPIGLFESKPFEGIEQLLAALKADGRRLAITTLKPTHMAETLLKRSGLYDYFDMVCGIAPDVTNFTKSELALMAMEHFGGTPEDTVLVGDTKYDINGAHGAHLKAVGVRYGFAPEGELEAAGADYFVNTVEELKEFLLGGFLNV